ncbi:hypothetical protein Moror_861 [Moniliophthora roreri MCA 2997]|uniref:Uncharacterized protein n=1 Tax=Moniliophthora roreri (strain MCA 2997) TaxID=1381753 RepID=V2XAP2_MONRO|nr:hypothetical protein Moror_861 [Moniliophthora roreri MCA 2997]
MKTRYRRRQFKSASTSRVQAPLVISFKTSRMLCSLDISSNIFRYLFQSLSTSLWQACKSSFNCMFLALVGPDEQWGVSQRVFGEGHWGMTWIVCFGDDSLRFYCASPLS